MTYFFKFVSINNMQYKNFGKFLKNKRESIKPKMTLNRFAINNDIEPAIISRIENMKQDVKLVVLGKIANGFEMTVSELMDEYEKSEFSNN